MVVRIRLARHGRRNLPYYHIVVANARTARNSKPLEKLGTYNPIPDSSGNKVINLNFERAKYWLTVGAQPSETVQSILVKAELMPAPPKTSLLQQAAKKFKEQAEAE